MKKISFEKGFNGSYIQKSQEIKINNDTFKPYDLLLAGLASCFYSTFLDACHAAEVEIYGCDVEVNFTKKNTLPRVLETVDLTFNVDTKANQYQINKLLKQAYESCSMVATIGQSVKINYQALIKDHFSIYLK